jgi:hypothetical protein
VAAENLLDGALMLKPECETLSVVAFEIEVKVFRGEEFIEHLERVAETEDDLRDYEPE